MHSDGMDAGIAMRIGSLSDTIINHKTISNDKPFIVLPLPTMVGSTPRFMHHGGFSCSIVIYFQGQSLCK